MVPPQYIVCGLAVKHYLERALEWDQYIQRKVHTQRKGVLWSRWGWVFDGVGVGFVQ